MDLIVLGPGRAGTAIGLVAVASGHRIVGVAARDATAAETAAERLESRPLVWGDGLPTADLLVVAVRDAAIAEVADVYAGRAADVEGATHLSGLVPPDALSPLGVPVAAFHPLQTIPTAEAGAERLSGAFIGITSDDDLLSDRLFGLARSFGSRPFELANEVRAVYHAAAAASANYTIAALAVAHRLFAAAGVDPAVAEPLVRAVVDNALAMGPLEALTGPISRGDVETVRAQVEAVRSAAPDVAGAFEAMAIATGIVADATDTVSEALR
jgi:predicted short-subunit dehydrogenase-like oxidoreductase (DUF2520 family)